MKRPVLLLLLSLLMLIGAPSLLAQEATPEATPEAQPTLSEIFASLPQTRLDDGGFVVGEPTAPITIIEFADYACPHCQDYRPVIDQVIEDSVATGQAKYELRIFPTAGREHTYYVGQLVECAEEQRAGAFWQSYELLYDYATSGKYDDQIASRLAADLDLNEKELTTCAKTATQIDTDIALAQSLQVTGTPAVMVRVGDGDPHFITFNDRTYSAGGVPYDVLEHVIIAANAQQPMPEATPESAMVKALGWDLSGLPNVL